MAIYYHLTYRYFKVLSILILLGSCQKDKLSDEKHVLSGSWHWLYTQHSYGWCTGTPTYELIMPDIIGKTHSISFIEKGKIVFYEDGRKEGKFRIIFNQFVKLNESTYTFQLKLDNDNAKIIEGVVKQDTLNIKYPFVETDPNCENYLNFFVRE